MSSTRQGLTRGRLAPFKCGHKGWGAGCNRCAQGNELLKRAEEVLVLTKTKVLPSYVALDETAEVVTVKAGARRFTAPIKHLRDLCKEMQVEGNRLLSAKKE